LNLTAIPQGPYDKSHGPYGASRVESEQFRSKKGLNLVIKTLKNYFLNLILVFFLKVTLIAKKNHLKKNPNFS
jgi:hypothetical protein